MTNAMYERSLPEYLANDLAFYWKADGPHVTAQGAKVDRAATLTH